MTVEERDYMHKEIDNKWIGTENIPDNMNVREFKAFAEGMEYALMYAHDIVDEVYRRKK